jgi:murein DD-endopeptidase MepM/ murein hydrolase activator NlpD
MKIAALSFFACVILASCKDNANIRMEVVHAPAPVTIAGKTNLYYELHLENYESESFALHHLEIISNTDATLHASFSNEELGSRWVQAGQKSPEAKALIQPQSKGVIYLEIELPRDQQKLALTHHLKLINQKTKVSFEIHGANISHSATPQLSLGPPLTGGSWAAVYHPSWERGHRRVFYTQDGRDRIPGRFAIDFFKLDSQGRYANGAEDSIKNWYGYGMDVLAVADGSVASVEDGISESPTLSGHQEHRAEAATGNYISIDLGNHHFAFYEHLKPGSIKVKAGAHVKKGDPIALVGFTGSSSGPHLHFHVAESNSPLGAEGSPFVFESFTQLGTYTDFTKFGKAPWTEDKNGKQSGKINERPAPNSIIEFDHQKNIDIR